MTLASSAIAPLLIRGAQVLLPSGELATRDVAIADGMITQVERNLSNQTGIKLAAQIIDATRLTLLPGVIGSQVSFFPPPPSSHFQQNLLAETSACAKGGITSFLEMPGTPPLTTTQAMLTDKLAIAAAHSVVNYGFFIGATAENESVLRTAHPTCGISLCMDEVCDEVRTDEPRGDISRIFATGDDAALPDVAASPDAASPWENRLIAVYSNMQDRKLNSRAVEIAMGFAKKYQRRLHVLSINTQAAAHLLRKDKPSWVSAGVTPDHLLLSTDAGDRDALWQALLDGVIDLIATDHTTHAADAESAKTEQGCVCASVGLPGTETALPLMLTQTKENRCTVAQVSHWMSTAVAEAYRIPNKGLIEPGFDADLVLVDLATYRPVRREELITKRGWSPFEGWNLTGWPVVTIVGGQVVYDRGQINSSVRGQALRFG